MIEIKEDFLAQAYRFRLMHAQKECLDVSVLPTSREKKKFDLTEAKSQVATKYVIRNFLGICHR